MKAWKKWGRFRFKRPLHENSLKDLREIRQGFKAHKRELSAARPRGLTRFWKEYRLVMKKRAWVFTMYASLDKARDEWEAKRGVTARGG